MSKRVLWAVLLISTMLCGSSVPVRGQPYDRTAVEERITAEEEREALLVARQFVKSFEESGDLLALIDKFYVRDFDARLRRGEMKFYIASVEPEVIAQAADEDLRRFYAASINFGYTGGFLYALEAYNRKLAGDEADDGSPAISKLLPPYIIAVMKSDPILAEIIAEDEEEERGKSPARASEPEQVAGKEAEKEGRADGGEIRSLERLRSYVSALEKAALLIRAYIKTLPGPRTWAELSRAYAVFAEKEGMSEDGCSMCPRINILRADFFGCPAGTRLVSIDLLAFRMDMLRVDGRLRILSVYVAD
jgi:hypothetical protein